MRVSSYDLEPDHINAQQLRVFVSLIVRRCRSAANAGQRLVGLLDNQAATGAAAKKREMLINGVLYALF